MISTNDRAIRKIVVIDAPPDMVFKAISDEKELIEWFPDLAVLEPKEGWKYYLDRLIEHFNSKLEAKR